MGLRFFLLGFQRGKPGIAEKIFIKNDFLWPDSEPKNILRRRSENSSVKAEWICDEEIIQAIYFVLNSQYSTGQEDLIAQVLKTLGVKSRSQNAKNRINNINKLKQKKFKILQSNYFK